MSEMEYWEEVDEARRMVEHMTRCVVVRERRQRLEANEW